MGPVHNREKALALQATQVLAIPGRVGLVAIDSFASGRPVITTDWPWHAPEFEYLNDENSLTTNDTPSDYAHGINELLNNTAGLAKMQETCRAQAPEFTVSEMARRFLFGLGNALALL